MSEVTTIHLDFVNAYLVKAGAGFILIDTGLPYQRERLEKELLTAGCLPDKLKLVVITHGDWDHIGSCAFLQENYKAKIAMHLEDAFMAEGGAMLRRSIPKFSRKVKFLYRQLKRRLRGIKISVPPFRPDVFLSDGQDLKGYGLDAKVLHLPGHTRGSLAVLTADGDLFAGDTFINREGPESAEIIQDAGGLKNSLARIRKMHVVTVYPGHGEPFAMKDLQ